MTRCSSTRASSGEAVAAAGREGVRLIPLFNDGREDVRIEEWRADAGVLLDVPGGFEALVLEGSFAEGGETFTQHSWSETAERLPSRRRRGGHAAVGQDRTSAAILMRA